MKRIAALVLGLAACSAPDTGVALSAEPPRSNEFQGASERIHVPVETYTLPNGMTVVLHEDHSLPKVVINTSNEKHST